MTTELQQTHPKELTTAALPPGIPVEQEQIIATKVAELVARVQNPLDRRAIEELATVGLTAERHATEARSRVNTQLQELMTQGGESSKLAKDLVALRTKMESVNPNQFGLAKVRRIPLVGPIAAALFKGWIEKTGLRNYVDRVNTVQQEIDGAIIALKTGKDEILRDNSELVIAMEGIDRTDLEMQRDLYVLRVYLEQLLQAKESILDQAVRDRIDVAIARVVKRAMDLTQTRAANSQTLMGMEIARENNLTLADSVDRTSLLAKDVLMNGVLLRLALAKQKDVTAAVIGMQDAIANQMIENARSVNQSTEEIAKLASSPIIAMDKQREAHRLMTEAMDKLNASRVANIDKMRTITVELEGQLASDQKKLGAYRTQEALPGDIGAAIDVKAIAS